MTTPTEKYSRIEISPEEANRTLDRLLNSKYFVNAHKKKKFLSVICDFYLNGRASELNEYVLGYDVFDCGKTYNPTTNPIVRVVAHDVRKKLELFYLNEGAQDEIRLEIPPGSYQPVFSRVAAPALASPATNGHEIAQSVIPLTVGPAEPSLEAQPVATKGASSRGLALTAALILTGLVSIGLIIYTWTLREQIQSLTRATELGVFKPVWQQFFSGDASTLVILSNPPVYRFVNPNDPASLAGKSVSLTDEQINSLSETFQVQNNPAPRLTLDREQFTGIGEAIGLQRVSDFFRSVGRSVQLKQSRTVSAEDLKDHNIVLLGSVWANEWSGKLPVKIDFVYSGKATIINSNPGPGEQAEYVPVWNERTGSLLTDYALITVRPNISAETSVMVLEGVHSEGTEAAAVYVTSKTYVSELGERLQQIGGQAGLPRYYQALLRVGVEHGIPTTTMVIAVHRLDEPNH